MANPEEREWILTQGGWIWIGSMEDAMSSIYKEKRPKDRLTVWMDIKKECDRQDEKWGEQTHDDSIWLAILTEEVGELAQAILHNLFGGKAAGTARTELIHVVAVGVQWLACMDRR